MFSLIIFFQNVKLLFVCESERKRLCVGREAGRVGVYLMSVSSEYELC